MWTCSVRSITANHHAATVIRSTSLLLFVFTMFVLTGCDDTEVETERGVIRGQVFGQTEAGRAPLAGAEISVVALLVDVTPPDATTTDSDGAFELSDVAPGGYGLEVSREGYEAAYELVRVDDGVVREVIVTLQTEPSTP